MSSQSKISKHIKKQPTMAESADTVSFWLSHSHCPLAQLLYWGHTLRECLCTGGIGKGKENKKLNVVDMLTV
jgi:hypothetical protein